MPKVLIIGLDGATWQLLAPWARDGRMPSLARLMARGTWGPLRSTVPALTLPAWSSFMTGGNPGRHGVFAFRRFAPGAYEQGGLANARDLRAPTLWDIAGRAGKRVGVINVPPSYPLRPVNGFVVGCMLTPPGERLTEPADVAAELGAYTIDVPAPPGLRPGVEGYRQRALAYLRELHQQVRQRLAATLRLMQSRPVDLLCVVFSAPDRVQHCFWSYLDGERQGSDPEIAAAVADVYAAVDEAVGRLVAAAGQQTAVVCLSDHGFTTAPECAVHVNLWLAQKGFLRRRPLWKVRRKVVRKLLPRVLRAHYDTLGHIQVDYRRTAAWSETIFTDTAGIWVHVRGRYPLGCVAPGDQYEAVREGIVRGLGDLRDEQGRPVFRIVARREDLYCGPYVTEAPDIVAVCNRGFGLLFESLRRDLRQGGLFGAFGELGYDGTHDPQGMYLFAGPPIAPLGQHREYPIEAIAPTVLHLLGVPVPRNMEGKVCTSVFREEFLRDNPPRAGEAVSAPTGPSAGWDSEADEAKVAARLRGLGYLA